jgi:hypothetical protein
LLRRLTGVAGRDGPGSCQVLPEAAKGSPLLLLQGVLQLFGDGDGTVLQALPCRCRIHGWAVAPLLVRCF